MRPQDERGMGGNGVSGKPIEFERFSGSPVRGFLLKLGKAHIEVDFCSLPGCPVHGFAFDLRKGEWGMDIKLAFYLGRRSLGVLAKFGSRKEAG